MLINLVFSVDMLMRDLINLAYRVALYDEMKEESDPDFVKILSILNLKIKNILKDLIEAVKTEDEELTIHVLHIMMDQFEEIFKYMKLRDMKNKLKFLVDKEFS